MAVIVKTAAQRRADVLRASKWRCENRARFNASSSRSRRANPARALFKSAKYRASKRGLTFTLCVTDIVIPAVCPVFGRPLVQGVGFSGAFSPTLDRIDNTKGYTPDNVIVVSRKANAIKGDATPAEIDQVARFYRRITRSVNAA